MATRVQKTSLPVIGEVIHHKVRKRMRIARAYQTKQPRGARVMEAYAVPLKYAPMIDTGKSYRKEPSLKDRARKLLGQIKELGA